MTQPYQLTANSNIILRVADGACIPVNELNADYQVYQVWVAAGNTPDPAPAPVVVSPPQSPLSVLAQVLVSKGLVSQTDLNTAAADAGVSFDQTGS